MRINKTQKHQLHLLLLSAMTGMGLAVYAYLGKFTRLLADDFCSLYFADRLGLFRSIWYWYLNWSGRYTAFAADWFVLEFTLGPYLTHYIVPATILIWVIFVTITLYLSLQDKGMFALLHSLVLSGMFLFAVLLLSPNIPQSLFWWNGMRSYALPLVVLTFYIFLFQLNDKHLKINLPISCGLGFSLLFISGEMSETIAVVQTAFILFLIGLQVLKLVDGPGRNLIILYASLAGAICSLIVVILSPGNAIRQALLPPPPDLPTLATISIQAYLTFISGVFLDPKKLAGLIGIILTTIWIGGYYKGLPPLKTPIIPMYILGGVALSFVCFPPGVYGYSEPPPTRTMIIPVFFLVGSVLYASFLTGHRLAKKKGSTWVESNLLLLVIFFLIGYSTITTIGSLYEERQVYIEFAEMWDKVDTQILQAKTNNLEFVNIPAMDNWAGLERPTDNPKYWPTICYSSHYGIQVFGPPYP